MVSKKSKKAEASSSTSTSTSSALDQISNFHILPIHMPSLTLTSASQTSSAYKNIIHYLYIKKHESPREDPKTPKDRTLFVLNVPVDATEAHFRDLFKPYGRIAAVHFISRIRDTSLTKEEREHQEELEQLEREAELREQEAHAGGNKKGGKKGKKAQSEAQDHHHHHRTIYSSASQAYVVFLEEPELAKALAMKRKKRSWIDTGSEGTKLSGLGVSKWLEEYHHKRPAVAALQTKVDEYMDKFERSEYEAQQAALARHNVMDEDGFTLVTSAGHKGANSDGVISIKAVKAEEAQHIKPKKKELQDFYRFQMREAKRDKLVDLRRKFEEDKVRIEALKVNRRFKPY
ncbi:Ribosomal RNA-processing protein 7 [Mortierella antarctica]|nr:Ribosomal RNA-processing protein 7 [Mortierella antarctica]